MIQLRRILVPTDFSTFSQCALDYGCAFAERFRAELHLLHVVDDYFLLAPEANLTLPDRDRYRKDLVAAAERELQKYPAPGACTGAVLRKVIVGTAFLETI